MVSTLVAVYAIPILAMTLSTRGMDGYFHVGTCMGGHEEFGYVQGDGYFSYCPGHRDRMRLYSLRPAGEEWEAFKSDGSVAFRMKVVDGDLYRSSGIRTNWLKEARVYNPWRLWIPRLLPE